MREFYGFLETEQPRVNAFLFQEIAKLHPLVRPVVELVFQGGGKRLRPMLLLLVARSLGHTGQDIYPMACALEFLHSATLLHDDVLDGAELRRGMPAAHTVYGLTQTILAGDALLALGNRLMTGAGDPRLTACISDAIMSTVVGEIAEIAHTRDAELNVAQYLEIITGKTAYLIQAACRCGAIIAGADEKVELAASEFGLNLGIAFQLVDDALDYAASQDQLGKPVGSDLREGKFTLPLLYYLQQADASWRHWFVSRLASGAFEDHELQQIVEAIRGAGCDTRTKALAQDFLAKAAQALTVFPESEEQRLLELVLNYVLSRDK